MKFNRSQHFVAFGFDLLEASDRNPLTMEDIQRALRGRRSHSSPHQFFEEPGFRLHHPAVLEVAGVVGLECDARYTEAGQLLDVPSMWRLAENYTGVELVGYWEDTDWVQDAVKSSSSREWSPGRHFWPEIQIKYVDAFLASVRHFAEVWKVSGQVRVRVSYRGLSGRVVSSASPGAYYSRDYTSRQNEVNFDGNFELDALDDTVRSSAVAAIVQTVNRFFQGPEITPEIVVDQLRR